MSKLFLLYSTILVGLLFLLVPANEVTMSYPFSDMTVSLEYYIYSFCEKAVLIIFAYVVASEAVEYRKAIWIFFWLLVVDMVDYLLTYSSIWFSINGFPVSMNTSKSFIFGGVILYELCKKLLK